MFKGASILSRVGHALESIRRLNVSLYQFILVISEISFCSYKIYLDILVQNYPGFFFGSYLY